MKLAIVFPGQGSQSVGMLKELAASFEIIRQTFEEASDTLGYNLWTLAQEGPEEKLNSTEFTQPVLLTAGVAVWRLWLSQGGKRPAFLAGHSLGEYTALVCAEAFAFADGLKLVQARGRLMQAACPEGVGAMAAIIGAPEDLLENICKDITASALSGEIVAPANYNAIGQTVIAGHKSAVDAAVMALKAQGVKRAIFLPVSVPSHCLLMKPAAEKMAVLLNNINIQSPNIPVIHNIDAQVHPESQVIKQALVEQLYKSVQWVKTIQFMHEQSVDTVIESGPGKALVGLIKRIEANIASTCIDSSAALDAAMAMEEKGAVEQ